MAQHADPDEQPRRAAGEVRAQVLGVLASAVRWLGLLLALVLVIHVLLTVGSANPQNGITTFFADAADPIAIGFKNLFTPTDPKLYVLVNYGIAALFWLVVSGVLARILRRLA
jgi:hypothetical protein